MGWGEGIIIGDRGRELGGCSPHPQRTATSCPPPPPTHLLRDQRKRNALREGLPPRKVAHEPQKRLCTRPLPQPAAEEQREALCGGRPHGAGGAGREEAEGHWEEELCDLLAAEGAREHREGLQGGKGGREGRGVKRGEGGVGSEETGTEDMAHHSGTE